MERSIYLDLLFVYYDTEQALALDVAALCRKVVARSEEEKSAVLAVLDEFFHETPNGWFHDRCEEEIAEYRKKSSQASTAGKASAAARAERRMKAMGAGPTGVERRANENPTGVERALNGRATVDQRELNTTPTNQEPITSNQKPEEKPSCAAALDEDGNSGTDAGVTISAKKPAAPADPPAYTLPLNTGDEFGITEQRVAEFAMLYPAVDVMQELRNMRGWLTTNPTKRKTKTGILKFVNAWLSKRQDSAGAQRGNAQMMRHNGRPSINSIGVAAGADDDIFNQMQRELPQ